MFDRIKKNQHIVKCCAESILYCGRQCIALRGDIEKLCLKFVPFVPLLSQPVRPMLSQAVRPARCCLKPFVRPVLSQAVRPARVVSSRSSGPCCLKPFVRPVLSQAVRPARVVSSRSSGPCCLKPFIPVHQIPLCTSNVIAVGKRKPLIDLCKTRWAERHSAYIPCGTAALARSYT